MTAQISLRRAAVPFEGPQVWTGAQLAEVQLVNTAGMASVIRAGCDYRFENAGPSYQAALELAQSRAEHSINAGDRTIYPAQAVLQASDGIHWVTALKSHGDSQITNIPVDNLAIAGMRSVSISPTRPALRAVVGQSTRLEFPRSQSS